MDQNECICGNKSFPEKWAKPTCGGSTGGKNYSRRKKRRNYIELFQILS